MTWPRKGRCGACTRPAEQAPSGRWWHLGKACSARSVIGPWPVDSLPLHRLCVFVPDGEPLPTLYPRGHMVPTRFFEDTPIPSEFGWVNPDHFAKIVDEYRALLLAEVGS